MKSFIGIISLFLFVFGAIQLVGIASPFEYRTCNLGWKHVYHKHNEASYQQIWCSNNNGIMEYKNRDFTKVDCLTKNNAVEFDFSNKWAESIGQALHYQKMTGKKGKVVLILENPKKEMIYFKRVEALAKIYDFDAEYITPKILNVDKNNKCKNPNCKCHKERVIKPHDWWAFSR